MARRLGPSTVYVSYEAAWGLFFYTMATIASVYRIVEAGLDPLQLVLVGTVLEATTLLFEIPTGVVADTISRRTSVILGTFLIGAGFVLEGSVPEFRAILVAQVVWGIGYTFTSGADVAWIADEIGEQRASALYLRAAQVAQVASFAGIFLSVWLATIALAVPIVVAGALFMFLGIFLLLFMREEAFVAERSAARRLRGSFTSTWRSGVGTVRARPILLTIFAVAALHGMSTEGFDRLWELHLLRDTTFPSLGELDSVIWFGIINAGGLLLAALAAEVVRRRVDLFTEVSAPRTLAVVNGLLIAGVVGFGLATSFAVALAAFWAVTVLRELNAPVYTAWLNQGLDPRARATVNSMGSQVDALGQVAGGPVLGIVGAARSVQAAIVLSGLVRAPSLLLFARALRPGPGAPRKGGTRED